MTLAKQKILLVKTLLLVAFGFSLVLPLGIHNTGFYVLEVHAVGVPGGGTAGAGNAANNIANGRGADGTSEQKENPETTKADLGLNTFQWILYQFFTGIGGIVLWFGGFMLDYAMKLLVVDMAGAITRFGMSAAIDSLWTVVRDIFNLLFIFGLIYIGFMTILRSDDSGTKRLLGTIIAAALLINFSLYVTKVIIDFSNVAAYQIYQLIQIDGSYQSALVGEVKGVAGKFIEMTDLSSYTKSASGELNKIASSSFGTFKVLGFSIIVMIFMLMSGFVFLSGAILLLSRFITLILLMIFSPAMFLGFVFPGFATYSTQWWNMLLKNAFVAPAYIFMIYLSLRTLETMQFSSSSFGEAYSTEAGETGLFGFFLYYLIIIGFVYASLVVARSMGAAGASQAINIGKGIANRARGYAGAAAGGATLGLAAAGLRATVGRRSQELADSDDLKRRQSAGGLRGWLARREMGLLRAAGDSSFDARQVGGVGEKLGVGAGHKGGYKTRTEELIKKEKEYAESLGIVPEDDAKVVKLQTEVDATEASIKTKKKDIRQLQKDKKNTTNEEEQRRIQAEIDNLKAEMEKDQEDVAKQKEAVQRERYRYQLGSVAEVARGFMKVQKDSLEKDLADYADARRGTDKKLQDELREKIAKKQVRIAELEKAQNKVGRGYATEVEGLSPVINFFLSRDTEQNKEAGKKIREEYKKKIKEK